MTTWDFRSLSALPSGWARRGVSSETFASTGMTATYSAGQSHYFTLPAGVAEGTLEVKLVSGPTSGAMVGPMVTNANTVGGCAAWYNVPSGCQSLSYNSSYTYSGAFSNAGGTPGYPAWLRMHYTDIAGPNASIAASYSTDGVSWSSEASVAITPDGNAVEVAIGSIFGSGTVEIEYAKWTEPSTPIDGSFAATLPVPEAAFSGTYDGPAEGTLAAVLPTPVGAFEGSYDPPLITGSFAATLPVPQVAFSGAPREYGSFEATLPLPVARFGGVYRGPYPTDTSNGEDGLDIVFTARVSKPTTPATVPPGLSEAVKYDKAIAYPTPTMVNGRPT